MTSSSGQHPRTPAAWWLATCFGLGWMKPGPGTWASVAAFLLWLPLAFHGSSSVAFAITLLLSVLSTVVGIPVSSRVAREANIADPGFVVIDEAAGTWTALLAACWPFAFGLANVSTVLWTVASWKAGIAALLLFRVFDIWKPWPVSALDRMHGGAGIMLDDIAAGIYAAFCVLLLRHFSFLS